MIQDYFKVSYLDVDDARPKLVGTTHSPLFMEHFIIAVKSFVIIKLYCDHDVGMGLNIPCNGFVAM